MLVNCGMNTQEIPDRLRENEHALRARGVEVAGASTVAQAMTLAATQRFDAVVLDCELPDGSGCELAARLRVRL